MMYFCLKVVLILVNNADPDELHHYISSGSSLFAKVPIQGFPLYKGLTYELKKCILYRYEINCEVSRNGPASGFSCFL